MTAKPFEVVTRRQGETAILDLSGEINSFADSALNAAYTEAVHDEPTAVVLNFSDVTYINSTGIALIVGLLAQARKAHRKIIAYGLTEHYQQIFEITRLSDFMNIHSDEADALADTVSTTETKK
jgi:anti-anti-sigma factor